MTRGSGETNAASLRPAGALPRLWAGLIDFFVLFMQYNVVVFLFSLAGLALSWLGRVLSLGRPAYLVALAVYRAGWVWSALVALAYFPYWWARGGQTFGMRMLRLRVVTANEPGGRVGWVRAVGRGLAALLSLGALALGFAWIVIDERHQGWHDKLAGTLVVHIHDTNGDR